MSPPSAQTMVLEARGSVSETIFDVGCLPSCYFFTCVYIYQSAMLERLLCLLLTLVFLLVAAAEDGPLLAAPLVQVEARHINAVQMHSHPLEGEDLMHVEELGHENGRHANHRYRGTQHRHARRQGPGGATPARRQHRPRGHLLTVQGRTRLPSPPCCPHRAVKKSAKGESLGQDDRSLWRLREQRRRLQQELQENERLKNQLERQDCEQKKMQQLRHLEQDKLNQLKRAQNLTQKEQTELEHKLQQQLVELQKADQQKPEKPKEEHEKADKEKLEHQILKELIMNHTTCQKDLDGEKTKEEYQKQKELLKQKKKLLKREQRLGRKLEKLQDKLDKKQQGSPEEKKRQPNETVDAFPSQGRRCSCCSQRTAETTGASAERNCCPQRCLSSQGPCCSQEKDPTRVDTPQTPPSIAPCSQTAPATPLCSTPKQITPRTASTQTTPPQTSSGTSRTATKEEKEELSPQKVSNLVQALRQAVDMATPKNQSKPENASHLSNQSKPENTGHSSNQSKPDVNPPANQSKLEDVDPSNSQSESDDANPPTNQSDSTDSASVSLLCTVEDSAKGDSKDDKENPCHHDETDKECEATEDEARE